MSSVIYRTPEPDDADLIVIEGIRQLRHELSRYVRHRPRRWAGHLRRMSLARAVRGSNWIEGYRASLDDVLAVMEDEEPVAADEPTLSALAGYRDAMTYVLELAEDRVTIDESLLKSLHYMMTKHELRIRPGRYRTGDVWVEDESGSRVYQAPDAALVDDLVGSLVESLGGSGSIPVMFQAAMAHLNLVRNTAEYCAVLSEVGQGSWQPHNSARPWTRFMLRAHYRQAWTLQRRVHETEQLYDGLSQLIADRGVPPRSIGALADASRGRRLQRSIYSKLVEITDGAPISDLSASRDLRGLTDSGLLTAHGAGRGRAYHGSADLRQLWSDIRSNRPPRAEDDPYDTLAQQSLPGIGAAGC